MVKSLLIAFIFLLCFKLSFSQMQKADTAFVQASISNAIQVYETEFKNQSHLYNGSEYRDYQPLEDEHPFFPTEDWEIGSVMFDGQLYKGVPLIYDIQKDLLITEYIHSGNMMQLVTAKVNSFTLQGHTYIRMIQDNETPLETGFYDLLYDGQVKVYARRTKTLQENTQSGRIERRFDYKVRYYIFKDKTYNPVYSKSSVLKIFMDKKQELRQQFGKSRLNYKMDREKSIVQFAQLYDSLTR